MTCNKKQIKPVIKNKLKDLLSESKKLKVKTVLALDYKKLDDHKSMRKTFIRMRN